MRKLEVREELADKRFTSIDPEIRIRGIIANVSKDNWQKIGLYVSRYKEKWETLVKEYEDETVCK
jgi:hypothetical protein